MLFSLCLIFVFNLFLFYFYKNISKIYNLFDIPDFKRKIHYVPVPLLGGLFIFLNIIIVILIYNFFFNADVNHLHLNEKNIIFFSITSILVYLIGFFDDKYDLSPNIKFITIALLLLFLITADKSLLINLLKFSFYEKNVYLYNYSYFITILSFLLFINAFNMLDGINGQSASYACFILIIFIIKNIFLFLSSAMLICIFFFLLLNFKNRIYLGDSGSLLIGFLLSYIFVFSYNLQNSFFADEIFLIMSVPGFDLLRLSVKRLINKKHPFSGDRMHLHHILIKKLGYVKTFFAIQLILILPYTCYLFIHNFLFSIIFAFFIYALVICYFDQLNFIKNITKKIPKLLNF
jgi:UDP-GlcNAc:undecaprenyl-phosphate GlcNAc-1-phosphate transferase